MFSSGQIIFAIFFIVIFVAIMIYTYRKDLSLHRKYYKGSLRVLFVFITFIVLIFLLKTFLKG